METIIVPIMKKELTNKKNELGRDIYGRFELLDVFRTLFFLFIDTLAIFKQNTHVKSVEINF